VVTLKKISFSRKEGEGVAGKMESKIASKRESPGNETPACEGSGEIGSKTRGRDKGKFIQGEE